MPTILLIKYAVSALFFWILLFGLVQPQKWSPAALLIVVLITLYPLLTGMLRRFFAIRCPGCKSWFVRVDYREGERGGFLFGWSWAPRWVEGHYDCQRCGHSWTKINRLPSGDTDFV